MSTYNICFRGEIRKISAFFGWKKVPYLLLWNIPELIPNISEGALSGAVKNISCSVTKLSRARHDSLVHPGQSGVENTILALTKKNSGINKASEMWGDSCRKEHFQQTTNWWYFSYFSMKTGFYISCKLSSKETICMKWQILFSGKNKKNISKCRLLKILPRVLSVKQTQISLYVYIHLM